MSPAPPPRTIKRQILSGYAVTLGTLVVLLIVAVVALLGLEAAHDRILEDDVEVVVDVERLGRLTYEIAVQERGYLITGDASALEEMDAFDRRFAEILAGLQRRARSDEGRALLAEIEAAKTAWDSAQDVVFAESRSLQPQERLDLGEERLFPPLRTLTGTLDEVIGRAEQRIADARAAADRGALIAIALVVALGLVAAVVAVLVGGGTVRRTGQQLQAVAVDIDAAASEILAGTEQQVAGAAEQASAVQQTVSSVQELTQTAGQSAERARSVADGAQASADAAAVGTQSVDATANGMRRIREQVESIAGTVLALTEHTEVIGEIVAAVDDIADRTHLLALNASVEAARAGEHGRGFGVVAGEIRALADEARQATARVGKLLGQIQQGATSAVLATEEGTRTVEDGVQRVVEAGQTIAELAETINAATLTAEQIAASSNQQAVATSQIEAGMRNIDEVMEANLASARQMEDAARGLDEVARRLKELVGAAQGG